jgi:hypothetical protein
MTYNITLTANHQTLTAEYIPLAANSVQYLTVKVVCETEDWTGLAVNAIFTQGCIRRGFAVVNGEITAKQQLNLSAGDWCVSLAGYGERDGAIIPLITTNTAHISVMPTNDTEGFPMIPPTAEEELRAEIGNLADLSTEDKSNLVAAVNELERTRAKENEVVKHTPQALTEAQQEQARTNISAEKAGTGYTKEAVDAAIKDVTDAQTEGFTIVGQELSNVKSDIQKKYTKPASGIPKADLAVDVQESLSRADKALQSVPDTYRTAAEQDKLDEKKQPKAIADAGGHFGANPTVESALQQLGGAIVLRTWTK